MGFFLLKMINELIQELNGLNTNTITPPAKFCKVPDKAIPTAKPAAPKIAIKEVI